MQNRHNFGQSAFGNKRVLMNSDNLESFKITHKKSKPQDRAQWEKEFLLILQKHKSVLNLWNRTYPDKNLRTHFKKMVRTIYFQNSKEAITGWPKSKFPISIDCSSETVHFWPHVV